VTLARRGSAITCAMEFFEGSYQERDAAVLHLGDGRCVLLSLSRGSQVDPPREGHNARRIAFREARINDLQEDVAIVERRLHCSGVQDRDAAVRQGNGVDVIALVQSRGRNRIGVFQGTVGAVDLGLNGRSILDCDRIGAGQLAVRIFESNDIGIATAADNRESCLYGIGRFQVDQLGPDLRAVAAGGVADKELASAEFGYVDISDSSLVVYNRVLNCLSAQIVLDNEPDAATRVVNGNVSIIAITSRRRRIRIVDGQIGSIRIRNSADRIAIDLENTSADRE
jgi:hypothetical protein